MRKIRVAAALALTACLALPATAGAEMVSYAANLATSRGNPVTDILILEQDAGGTVRASVYDGELPGFGTVVLTHDAEAAPVKTLIIGLTLGEDEIGNDKVQIVMFLDPDFAAANVGQPFSAIFPGARHNATITDIEGAAAGDAALLAHFADTFYSGPADGAAFDSTGAFAVAEFTVLTNIGQSATAGNWMITSFLSLQGNSPNAQSGLLTGAIQETAKEDNGPFDIAVTVVGGNFAIDKTVLNDTGNTWRGFVIELGFGVGPGFVRSTPGDGLQFLPAFDNREDTGALPDASVEEDRIVFGGGTVAPGESPRFIVFVQPPGVNPQTVTLRQISVAEGIAAPALQPAWIAVLAVGLAGLGAVALRRRRA